MEAQAESESAKQSDSELELESDRDDAVNPPTMTTRSHHIQLGLVATSRLRRKNKPWRRTEDDSSILFVLGRALILWNLTVDLTERATLAVSGERLECVRKMS